MPLAAPYQQKHKAFSFDTVAMATLTSLHPLDIDTVRTKTLRPVQHLQKPVLCQRTIRQSGLMSASQHRQEEEEEEEEEDALS